MRRCGWTRTDYTFDTMRSDRKKKEDIPVDKDGKVPFSAIVRRFHEVGKHDDARSTHSKVLPRELTPAEIEDWWYDPSVCDIEGVDTNSADIYSVPFSVRGKKRTALSKVAVIADKKECNRIKKILANSFTAEELERMTSDKSFIISTEKDLDDCTGVYARKQKGIPVPHIILEEGTTPDGIVHEAAHHLRAVDGRSPIPTKNGYYDPNTKMSKSKKTAILNKEEKETVAETIVRTRVDPKHSGYYDYIPDNRSARGAYLHDQAVLSGSKALKGKAAMKALEENYNRTSISRAIISANRKARK